MKHLFVCSPFSFLSYSLPHTHTHIGHRKPPLPFFRSCVCWTFPWQASEIDVFRQQHYGQLWFSFVTSQWGLCKAGGLVKLWSTTRPRWRSTTLHNGRWTQAESTGTRKRALYIRGETPSLYVEEEKRLTARKSCSAHILPSSCVFAEGMWWSAKEPGWIGINQCHLIFKISCLKSHQSVLLELLPELFRFLCQPF